MMKNSFVVKCIAIVLFAVFMTTLLLSGVCIVFGIGSGAFDEEKKIAENKERIIGSIMWNYERDIRDSVYRFIRYDEKSGCSYNSYAPLFAENILYEIKDLNNNQILYSSISEDDSVVEISGTMSFSVLDENNKYKVNEVIEETTSVSIANEDINNEIDLSEYYVERSFEITLQYKSMPIVKNNIYYTEKLFDFVSGNEAKLYIVIAISSVVSIILFIFILCVAGHKAGVDGIHISRFDEFPIDILTLIYLGLTFLLGLGIYYLNYELYYWWLYDDDTYIILLVTVLAGVGILIDWIMFAVLSITTAVRLKTRSYIKSTAVYKITILFIKLLKIIWELILKIIRKSKNCLSKVVSCFGRLLRKIPLVWKTILIVIALGFLEIPIYVISHDCDFPLWFIFNIVLGVFAILIAIILKQIKKGTEEIAKGNIYKKINTKYMFLDIKDHAENINNINDGIAKAVEERMKSERFKTELITNVSHDIKTPLTSIINYVDLLEKEEISNKTAKEYVDVLSRQSIRLKKLIDDLLEASKASTGNVSVNLSQFELGILLTQALGEYEERFLQKNLQIVLNKTDEMLLVMADSRHMWRIFDNILNNIEKYAQSGTRVYVDATRNGQFAEISFKNISKDALNISGDELMERFVRGDSSRNTEGSGLGLSIAKSLTEVQKGKLDIQIDGDLFKVRVTFPLNNY